MTGECGGVGDGPVCGKPGTVRPYPGPVPCSGSWCDECYRLEGEYYTATYGEEDRKMRLLNMLAVKGDAPLDLNEVFAMAAESYPDTFVWDGKTLHFGEYKDLLGLATGLGIHDYEMDNIFGTATTFADLRKNLGG